MNITNLKDAFGLLVDKFRFLLICEIKWKLNSINFNCKLEFNVYLKYKVDYPLVVDAPSIELENVWNVMGKKPIKLCTSITYSILTI